MIKRKPINYVPHQPRLDRQRLTPAKAWDAWVELSERARDAHKAAQEFASAQTHEAWMQAINAAADAWQVVKSVGYLIETEAA
jgi:hypothetical protein